MSMVAGPQHSRTPRASDVLARITKWRSQPSKEVLMSMCAFQERSLLDTLLSSKLPALSCARDAGMAVDDVLYLDGTYKLLSCIGRGSFGEVWRAEGPGCVEIAIKIVHGKLALNKADRELQALGLIRRLRHVYLLPLHAFWRLDDRLLIAMELSDGSLRDRHEECRRLGQPGIPPAELLRYIAEAAEALDFLHERRLL